LRSSVWSRQMKKTASQFDSEYKTTIPSIVFSHQKETGEPMIVKELYDVVRKSYDITRYKTESRARLLVGESLIETKRDGCKAFYMPNDVFDQWKNKKATLVGSGYDVDKKRDELDRAILTAVRAGMGKTHRTLHANTAMTSDKHAAWLCGVRYRQVIHAVKKKEENKHIPDNSIRSRCETLVKNGRLIKGERLGNSFPALVVRSHYLKLNRRVNKTPSKKEQNQPA
jgi:hypothetical protein